MTAKKDDYMRGYSDGFTDCRAQMQQALKEARAGSTKTGKDYIRSTDSNYEHHAASEPEVVLVARSQSVADLVEQCARGELPFSGPDSLHSKVSAMGFSTTSLYPAVLAAQAAIKATSRFARPSTLWKDRP
jgi:hypothetical protein